MSLEQESLLLLQVASLRRTGMDHHRAVELASAGLPDGPLRKNVQAIGRDLAAGTVPAAGTSPTIRALANAAASVEAVQLAAMAVEARLESQAAVRLTRWFVGLAGAGPLVVIGSASGIRIALEQVLPQSGAALAGLLAFPLALGWLALVWRFAARVAPGSGRFVAAAALLSGSEPDAAARGLDDRSRSYLELRRSKVGAAAGTELASELVADGRRRVELFVTIAPLAAAALLLPAAWFVVGMALGLGDLFEVTG